MPNRTPRSLDEAYLYATEVCLATLDELCDLKSSSGSRIRRQRSICLDMLTICQSEMVNKAPGIWGPDHNPSFPRVQRYLEAAKTQPEGLEGALDQYIRDLQGLRRKDVQPEEAASRTGDGLKPKGMA
jgi:hypothetical protein